MSGGLRSERGRGAHQRPGSRPVPNAVLTGLVLVAMIALWEGVVTAGILDVKFISKPSQVVSALVRMLQEADVREALMQTLVAVAVSFAIGAAIGLVVGIVIGLNRLLRAAYLPFVILLLGIPKSVFLPLFILFFGLGLGPGIAFGVILSSIQIVVNVVGGIDSIDRVYYRMARAYGAGPWQLFTAVILPGAAPGIFAGLWHGIRNAFIGVVIAQLFISDVGIGYLVRLNTNNFRIDDALALVFLVAAIVILAGATWEVVERRLSRWRDPRSRAAATA